MAPGVRNLVLAAVAAVLTSAGAVAVLMQPEDGTRKITGTNDAAPGLAWSVDAAAIYGQSSAEFRDPVGGTEFDFAGAGFVEAGDAVVAVIGIAEDSALREPKLYGFDAETGEKRWEAPAAGLGGCADVPVDGSLVCYTGYSVDNTALIGIDIADGTVTRTTVDWQIFSMAAVDDRLFIAEGNVESDDVRVHSGTLADPDALWTRQFAMGTLWEDLPWNALDVSHGQGLFTLGIDMVAFDLRTGETTWTAQLDGCSRTTPTFDALVVRVNTECDGYRVTGTDLLDRTGRVLATTSTPGSHEVNPDRPADATIPVLLGDAAYDRRDGTLRWTSPDLLSTPPQDQATDTRGPHIALLDRGTAIAILGDTAILRDPTTTTMTGLDLRNGQRLWRAADDRYGTIQGWDGTVAVLTDSTGLWAIEPRTGETVWEAPFLAINSDGDALVGSGEFTARGPGRYLFATPRTMLGLRPLD
ncbi:PQQ-binding-like beta-propeller repeat protein [Nocardia cyriacigeorgica]|nr:PQQ-binding-like beta-propeller repeat protein [Nocardia cyriacigeorgica]